MAIIKNFHTTVATPWKWLGLKDPHSPSVRPSTVTVVSCGPGYILHTRRINDTAARCLKLGEVARLVARIGGEILVWSKLRRIDEDRGDRHVATIERTLRQARMALMQRAHGRDHADGAPGRSELANRAA